MITTTAMRQLIAAVLEKDIDNATQALLQLGVIDFIDVREIPADWTEELQNVPHSSDFEQVRDLRKRLDAYFSTVGFDPSGMLQETGSAAGRIDLRRAEESLDEIGNEIRKVRDRQKQVQDEILKLQELQRQIPEPKRAHPELLKGGHSYITVFTGMMPAELHQEFEEALYDFPAVFMPRMEGSQDVDFLITLKRDRDRAEKLLQRFSWEERSVASRAGASKAAAVGRAGSNSRRSGASPEAGEVPQGAAKAAQTGAAAGSGTDTNGAHLPKNKIDEKISELRQQQEELKAGLNRSITSRKEELGSLWTGLRVAELSNTIRSHYRKTERTYLFSGWIPADKQKEVSDALMEATEGRAYLEWHNPSKGGDPEVPQQVPVEMRNPQFLSPFQSLVQNFGTPSYGSVDPTPVVAVFYLAMFGLMFGDVGHGLVVFLVGFLGNRAKLKQGKRTMIFPLITWCGVAAMVTGAMFGSYFGLPLLPPLWFDFHGVVTGHSTGGSVRTIMDILVITIYFGITVISVGLLLNWINRFRRRDWIGLIWENGGLLVGWLYGAGTYAAFYFVAHDYRELPPPQWLIFMLGIPVLLMGAKPVIEHFRHVRQHPEAAESFNILNMLMEWVVELLEIFSGYLSNTLSFMRVAGLGIAHVSLMVAFFQIAEMAASGGRFSIWSYLILLAGNVLVIGLEGLSAGIQSLRLNYYEFFSKYFTGSGRAYAPISLHSER